MRELTEINLLMDKTADWVIQLLQGLEGKAHILDPDHPDGIEDVLGAVREAIDKRLEEGQW